MAKRKKVEKSLDNALPKSPINDRIDEINKTLLVVNLADKKPANKPRIDMLYP
jgi:hypothetical protein